MFNPENNFELNRDDVITLYYHFIQPFSPVNDSLMLKQRVD